MSTHPVSTAGGSAERPPGFLPAPRSWKIATIVAVIMVLLALLGVALTDAGSAAARIYWVSLVPVYGLLCIGTAWARTHHAGGFDRSAVLRQFFHWLGIAIALGLDFFIRGTGEESRMGAALSALLLLALGCYLAGVHLDWLFVPVGVLLSVSLVIVTTANEYLWLIFLVGAAAIVAILGLMRFTAARTIRGGAQ